jgi:flagellar hook-associated protein 3 FlgL
MRVTQSETYRNFLLNLDTLNERLDKINSQIASGKKLKDLKDSPASSAQLIGMTDQAAEIDQYQSNISSGSYFLGTADSVLNEVNNLVASIYAKGSQAATESVTADDRATIGTEIRSMRDQIIALANSQALGRYIFAGSKTDSAPFTLSGDVVLYQGDESANIISVDRGLEVQEGVPGSAAFNSIFSAVDSLLTNVGANNLDGIKTALGQFASALSGLGIARGEIGANLSLLNNAKTDLDSQETSLKKQRSQLEDANMAESVTAMSQVQTALQTAMTAGGSILQQRNLFDILG